MRVLRPPLYVHALGEEEDEEGELRVVDAEPTAAYSPAEHAEEADGAMVLELPGACWQLPEFAGAIPQRQEVPRAFSCRLWPPPRPIARRRLSCRRIGGRSSGRTREY